MGRAMSGCPLWWRNETYLLREGSRRFESGGPIIWTIRPRRARSHALHSAAVTFHLCLAGLFGFRIGESGVVLLLLRDAVLHGLLTHHVSGLLLRGIVEL